METNCKMEMASKRDYPVSIKIILWVLMILSGIRLLKEIFKSMGYNSYFDAPTFLGMLIGGALVLTPYILIYNKKIVGLYFYLVSLMLPVLFFITMLPHSLPIIIMITIIRAGAMSLILFVPVRGVSVFDIMKSRKEFKPTAPY